MSKRWCTRRTDRDAAMRLRPGPIGYPQPLADGNSIVAIKDTIRYTFCYPDDAYAGGVQADCSRLKEAGFELTDFRNSWAHEEYKGINSRWRVPENGQLFEVQFHTQASFEAKEDTHAAYERLRMLPANHEEVRELRAYQRAVTAKIPIPPEAPDVPTS